MVIICKDHLSVGCLDDSGSESAQARLDDSIALLTHNHVHYIIRKYSYNTLSWQVATTYVATYIIGP